MFRYKNNNNNNNNNDTTTGVVALGTTATISPAGSITENISVIERALVARDKISDRAKVRKAAAEAEHEAFTEVFGTGGFLVVNVGEWYTVAAPELEELALRCKVPFRLQGGVAVDDPAEIILGSAHVRDLTQLGNIVASLVVLADARERMHRPQPVEVTSTEVFLAHEGHRYTVVHGELVATGKDRVATPVAVSDLKAA
jgi:hypothetical protein